MKKNLVIALVLALLIVFAGCNKNAELPTGTTTEMITSETLESEAESLDGEGESVAQTEQPTIEERASSPNSPLTETEKQTEKEKTQAKPPVTTAVRQSEPPVVTDAQPQTTAASETQAPTTAVLVASETQAPTSTSVTTAPSTTAAPALAPPIQAEFDPDIYVRYAISYGKSIGLTYHSEVHECWDNPIAANLQVSDLYMKGAIESKLNRYKNVEGMEYFNAWAENLGDGKYRIVIAYA